LHIERLPGKPDIVLSKYKTIVFVHGCFWHGHEGCKRATRPTSNAAFWNEKINGNMRRDTEVKNQLAKLGWKVLVVWQCRLKDKDKLASKLTRMIEGGNDGGT
jgi:DNA mismatch endonuclease (patch repair protein)